MAGAIERQAEKAYGSLTENQQRLAAVLLRCITERSEDRQAIRRPLSLAKIASIAHVSVEEMVPVVDSFRTNQCTFLTPAEGEKLQAKSLIDISHESLIRNWPRLGKWVEREAADAAELKRLHHRAAEFNPETPDPLSSTALERAQLWREGRDALHPEDPPQLVPSRAWAALYFKDEDLGRKPPEGHELEPRSSKQARPPVEPGEQEFGRVETYIAKSRKLLDEQAWQEWLSRLIIWLLVAAVILGGGFLVWQHWRAVQDKQAAEARAAEKEKAFSDAFGHTADGLAKPILAQVESAFREAEDPDQNAILRKAIAGAAMEPLSDQAVNQSRKARASALVASNAITVLAESAQAAFEITKTDKLSEDRRQLAEKAKELAGEANKANKRYAVLLKDKELSGAVETALRARLERAESLLHGLSEQTMSQQLFGDRYNDLLAARAELNAFRSIQLAAINLGLSDSMDQELTRRFGRVNGFLASTLDLGSYVNPETKVASRQIDLWTPDIASPAHAFPTVLSAEARITCARFAPNFPAAAPLLAIVSEGRNVWFWRKVATQFWVPTDQRGVNSLAFSPLGNVLAAAGNDSNVWIVHWPMPLPGGIFSQKILRGSEFVRNRDTVTDVAFSANGHLIASAGADHTVQVFNADNLGRVYFSNPPLPDIVTSVAFHPDNNQVVSGCDDGGVRLHTIDHPHVQLLGTFGAPARQPGFSSDGKLVVAASGDKTARVWSIDPANEFAPIIHKAPVTKATFRPGNDSGYTFVTTSTNGEVRLLRLANATPGAGPATDTILDQRHPGAAVAARWSDDGRWLATVGGGEVLVWEWMDGALKARLKIGELNPDTSHAEFSSDAKLLVTYGGDYRAFVWDLSSL